MNQSGNLVAHVLEAINVEIARDPGVRHPRIPVHKITRNVMLATTLAHYDRSEVLEKVCTMALGHGYVVEFETVDE